MIAGIGRDGDSGRPVVVYALAERIHRPVASRDRGINRKAVNGEGHCDDVVSSDVIDK